MIMDPKERAYGGYSSIVIEKGNLLKHHLGQRYPVCNGQMMD